jgi:nucleoside-diphosphate-sugar epimerase
MEGLKNMDNKKKILIIGASGYIGGHLNELLSKEGHQVYTTTNKSHLYGNSSIQFDFINSSHDILENWIKLSALNIDVAYVLAWPYLNDYKDERHVSEVLPKMIDLYKLLVNKCNIKNIVFTGTCFEYGKNGKLSETSDTKPTTNYAISKDILRKILLNMADKDNIKLKWVRLFYVTGGNQKATALFPSLENAIKKGDKVFKMSKGDQIRDFLLFEKVVNILRQLGLKDEVPSGIYNCGSGVGYEILELIEGYIELRGSDMVIDNTAYPYREDEPFAFWADMSKTNKYID